MGVLRTNRWIRKIRAYQGPWYPTVTHPGTQPAHVGTQLASYAGARGLTAVLPSWRWHVNFGIRSPVAPMRHVAAGTVGAGTGPILTFWVYSRHVRKVKCICRPSGRSNNQNFKILRVCLRSSNHPRSRDRSRIRDAESTIAEGERERLRRRPRRPRVALEVARPRSALGEARRRSRDVHLRAAAGRGAGVARPL